MRACANTVEATVTAPKTVASTHHICTRASSTGIKAPRRSAMMTSGGAGRPSLTSNHKRLMRSQAATCPQIDRLRVSTSLFWATSSADKKLRMRKKPQGSNFDSRDLCRWRCDFSLRKPPKEHLLKSRQLKVLTPSSSKHRSLQTEQLSPQHDAAAAVGFWPESGDL